MSNIDKARLWEGIGYPENMSESWKDDISELLQVPFAYCVHDKDTDGKGEHRKDHVHLILAFSNTTTQKHALNVLNRLSIDGKTAFSTCQAVIGPRKAYDYLIHDTEDSRKKKKYQYSPNERITGNGFDIGSYEQISSAEKREIRLELAAIIRNERFTNFSDFAYFVYDNCTQEHIDEMTIYSNFFDKIIKGQYHKYCKKADDEK